MTIAILKPGLLTTVQDNGRHGLQQYGIIVGGAMDTLSYRIGNLLLGQKNEAALEITVLGPIISFHIDTVIAITGADFRPLLDGKACPMWRPVIVKAGSILKMHAAKVGARGYICIKGGIQVEPVMGSRSTYLRAGLGGFQGRALIAGDRLPISATDITNFKTFSQFVDYSQFISFTNEATIRIIPGPEYDTFTDSSKEHLITNTFTISKDADRMGYRLQLDHVSLQKKRDFDLLSEAVTFGTIQVPPNGQPIVLMADHQTTGGYPKIAQVISIDLPKLAQLQPYSKVRFELVSLPVAQELAIKHEQRLRLFQSITEQAFNHKI